MQDIKNIIQKKICCCLLFCCTLWLAAQTPPAREYQIKAVFLFNFAQFVDWPADAFPAPDAPLVIAVLGVNPFGTYLRDAVAGEKVNGHPVLVQYYDRPEAIPSCHILFIGLSDAQKAERVISDLKDRSILTIGDQPRFLMMGGMIKFFTRKNNIRFEINPDAAKAAGLVLSSKLLRVAQIFDPSKDQ